MSRALAPRGGDTRVELAPRAALGGPRYAHFFAGPFIRETPPGKDIDYFTTCITYKF
jgi:hypothetical protein